MMTKEELVKEAEVYAKRQGSPLSETYGIWYRAYLDGAESREKHIADLEKKNKEQLTKAEELIKRLMYELVLSDRTYEDVKLLVEDVEHFLSEVDK